VVGGILLLNVGRRVEMVRLFRETLAELKIQAIVFGTDIVPTAPALYFCDQALLTPKRTDPAFFPYLTDVIKKNHIGLVVPFIDPDLDYLAAHAEELRAACPGTTFLVSEAEVIQLCRDKLCCSQVLADKGMLVPRLFLAPSEFGPQDLPLILKPRSGSSSQGIRVIRELEELAGLKWEPGQSFIQQFIDGEEYTVDCYVSLNSRQIISIVPRRRLQIRSGEISKGVTVKDQLLEDITRKVLEVTRVVGPAAIQFIKSGDKYYFTEINPRFGGGFPLSIQAGAHAVRWVLQEVFFSATIQPCVGQYETDLYMLRYDQSLFLKGRDLKEHV